MQGVIIYDTTALYHIQLFSAGMIVVGIMCTGFKFQKNTGRSLFVLVESQ